MMNYIKSAPSGSTSRIRGFLSSHLLQQTQSTGSKRCLDLPRRITSSSQTNKILCEVDSSCLSMNPQIQKRCNNTLVGQVDLKSSVNNLNKEVINVQNVDNINIRQDFDFFGEPITFFLKEENNNHHPNSNKSIKKPFVCEEALISYDTFIIQYITKGKSSDDGGDEFGISAKAAHSTAIPWSDLFKNLLKSCYQDKTNNGDGSNHWKCEAPMLACAAISPILALGGSSYLKLLDESYAKSMSPSFTIMSKAATSYLENQNEIVDKLSDRERYHLHALKYLLEDNHPMALSSLRKLLELCPGDALGLSLALDIASVIGDKQNAFYAATSVASYWNERGQRSATGQTAIPGYAIGSSLIALGLAVGGRFREAEQLVDIALKRDTGGSAGICAWAFAHIYDSEGRVSEGSSLYTGYGKEYYETCGFMFFDAIMAGIGGRFTLDRDGATADNVAKRLYDENFGRIFEYSGYDDRDLGPVFKSAPGSRRQLLVDSAAGAASSVFNQFFGQKNEAARSHEDNTSSSTVRDQSKSRTLEDVFAWLPPTPHLLTEATFFLVRLTIGGTIAPNDERWSNLCVAWEKAIKVEKNHGSNNELFHHLPIARVTASLVLGERCLGGQCSQTEIAASVLGSLMQVNCANINVDRDQWKFVAKTLSDIRSGMGEQKFFGWDQNFGNFLEHTICHAAIKSDDHEMFCLARSVCSESIALRGNSPETWFRYGVILQKLGDKENAENAFQASISLGSGEGGKITSI